MNVSEPFVRRPVMTWLVMLGIVIFGIVAYGKLPVAQLPNVDFPTIQVTATLPGASPDTMAAAVATPLEKEFSAIAGLEQMTSSSAKGSTQVTLQFDLGRDIDAAAQDVQTAITLARRNLPDVRNIGFEKCFLDLLQGFLDILFRQAAAARQVFEYLGQFIG